MQRTSDSKILLAYACGGSLAGAGYWLIETFFVSVLPWLRVPAHDLTVHHSLSTLILLFAYPAFGALLGLVGAAIVCGLKTLRENARSFTADALKERGGFVAATGFGMLCLLSYSQTQTTAVWQETPIYALALSLLLSGVAWSFGRSETPRGNLALAITGATFVALLLGNAIFSLVAWDKLFFFPIFFLLAQVILRVGRTGSDPVSLTSGVARQVSLIALFSGLFVLHAFLVEQAVFEPQIPGPERSVNPEWPNVVVIVLDTVRADHLSAYGYSRETSPNLEEFASRATLFTNAVATGPYSLPTHASMLTGLYSSWHGCHFEWPERPFGAALDSSFETMPETLRRNGYRTFGVAANSGFLNPAFGLTEGFEYFDYRRRVQLLERTDPLFLRGGISDLLAYLVGEENRDLFIRRASQINQATLDLLESRLRPTDRFFLLLNYMDAHGPYVSPEPFSSLFPGQSSRLNARSVKGLWGRAFNNAAKPLRDWERDHVVSQYDGAIRYLDDQVGSLLGELKARGLYDDSLIIITSDHGEAFGEDDLFGHGLSVSQPELHIPLIVKFPHQEDSRLVNQPVSQVDLFPTVMEAIGLQERPPVQGMPLQNSKNLAGRFVFSETFPPGMIREWNPRFMRTERAIYWENFKLILSTQGKRALYNLDEDPEETTDLYTLLPDTAQFLHTELSKWSEQIPSKDSDLELDAETLERLRSLGYIN